MGPTDDEATRLVLAACALIALLLAFYALRDAGALPGQRALGEWVLAGGAR